MMAGFGCFVLRAHRFMVSFSRIYLALSSSIVVDTSNTSKIPYTIQYIANSPSFKKNIINK